MPNRGGMWLLVHMPGETHLGVLPLMSGWQLMTPYITGCAGLLYALDSHNSGQAL